MIAGLLAHAAITEPFIPIQIVARSVNVLCRADDMPEGWDAMLVRGQKFSLLTYNARLSETKQRQSIAHELGHYFLHKGNGLPASVLEAGEIDGFRDGFPPELEDEADAFAAELLMPVGMIPAHVSLAALCDLFWVDESMMRDRLVTLGMYHEDMTAVR